jgi:tellurium resistance protein TerD
MAIELKKGQRTDIGLQRLGVGLGWNSNTGASPHPYDLDLSALLLTDSGKLVDDKFFVFYNNQTSPDGAVRSSGDNTTGEGDGDDETLFVELALLDPRVTQIVFTATIYEFEERRQNFGQVRDSLIRIYDQVSGQEICKYELDEDFSVETAIEFGRLYKRGDAWRFEATGIASQGGLGGLLAKYQ